LPERIDADPPILLLIGILHVRVAHGVEIERVARRVFHVPEPLLVARREGAPGGNARAVVPDDLLLEIERNPRPEEIGDWNGSGALRQLQVAEVQPEGARWHS